MRFFYLILFLVTISACSTTGKIEATGFKTLSFGTGGGFTNEVKTYSLLPDGALWLHNSLSHDSTFVNHVSKGKVRKAYVGAQALGLDTLCYSNPDNRYSFITVGGESSSNKIVWGNNQSSLPEGVNPFFTTLMELISK